MAATYESYGQSHPLTAIIMPNETEPSHIPGDSLQAARPLSLMSTALFSPPTTGPANLFFVTEPRSNRLSTKVFVSLPGGKATYLKEIVPDRGDFAESYDQGRVTSMMTRVLSSANTGTSVPLAGRIASVYREATEDVSDLSYETLTASRAGNRDAVTGVPPQTGSVCIAPLETQTPFRRFDLTPSSSGLIGDPLTHVRKWTNNTGCEEIVEFQNWSDTSATLGGGFIEPNPASPTVFSITKDNGLPINLWGDVSFEMDFKFSITNNGAPTLVPEIITADIVFTTLVANPTTWVPEERRHKRTVKLSSSTQAAGVTLIYELKTQGNLYTDSPIVKVEVELFTPHIVAPDTVVFFGNGIPPGEEVTGSISRFVIKKLSPANYDTRTPVFITAVADIPSDQQVLFYAVRHLEAVPNFRLAEDVRVALPMPGVVSARELQTVWLHLYQTGQIRIVYDGIQYQRMVSSMSAAGMREYPMAARQASSWFMDALKHVSHALGGVAPLIGSIAGGAIGGPGGELAGRSLGNLISVPLRNATGAPGRFASVEEGRFAKGSGRLRVAKRFASSVGTSPVGFTSAVTQEDARHSQMTDDEVEKIIDGLVEIAHEMGGKPLTREEECMIDEFQYLRPPVSGDPCGVDIFPSAGNERARLPAPKRWASGKGTQLPDEFEEDDDDDFSFEEDDADYGSPPGLGEGEADPAMQALAEELAVETETVMSAPTRSNLEPVYESQLDVFRPPPYARQMLDAQARLSGPPTLRTTIHWMAYYADVDRKGQGKVDALALTDRPLVRRNKRPVQYRGGASVRGITFHFSKALQTAGVLENNLTTLDEADFCRFSTTKHVYVSTFDPTPVGGTSWHASFLAALGMAQPNVVHTGSISDPPSDLLSKAKAALRANKYLCMLNPDASAAEANEKLNAINWDQFLAFHARRPAALVALSGDDDYLVAVTQQLATACGLVALANVSKSRDVQGQLDKQMANIEKARRPAVESLPTGGPWLADGLTTEVEMNGALKRVKINKAIVNRLESMSSSAPMQYLSVAKSADKYNRMTQKINELDQKQSLTDKERLLRDNLSLGQAKARKEIGSKIAAIFKPLPTKREKRATKTPLQSMLDYDF